MTHFLVPESSEKQRVDRVLRDVLGLSLKESARLCSAKRVLVGGKFIRKGDLVAKGAHIEVRGHIENFFVPNDDDRVKTIAETKRFIVLEKPSQMPCHPLVRGEGSTLADVIVKRWPRLAKASNDAREAGLVHRLDNDTSGLVLVATSLAAHKSLREALIVNAITRRYFAIVSAPIEDCLLDTPISHANSQKMKCDPDGREAQTRVTVIERFAHRTLLKIDLVGGRRHQIRVHLAHAGAPICGDALYGGEKSIARQALHACELEVERQTFKSEIPKDFLELIEQR